MKPSELKTGDRVLTRNGVIGIVMFNTRIGDNIIHDNEMYSSLKSYPDDNNFCQNFDDNKWDIMEVFDYNFNIIDMCDFKSKGKSVWKREKEVMIDVDGKEYSLPTLKKMIQQYVK